MEANETICFCKHVTLADIDAALAEAKTFRDLESAFEDVQKTQTVQRDAENVMTEF